MRGHGLDNSDPWIRACCGHMMTDTKRGKAKCVLSIEM